MLTIDALREYGANVEEGLGRCMNNEDFYLNMVKMACGEDKFELLRSAVEAGDLKSGFEYAHGLKGVAGNLSLTPLFDPLVEITEFLRSNTEMDYEDLLKTIEEKRDELKDIIG